MVARVLLDRGANVNARKQDQWTPIHLSAYNRHLKLVRLFVERGADVLPLNGHGETPYQILLHGGYRELADLLMKHGAGRDRFGEISLLLGCGV